MGYRLRRGLDFPPLMFTPDEARALAKATQMARLWLDPALALAASDAMPREMAVLPMAVRAEVESLPMGAPGAGLDSAVARQLQALREATQRREAIRLAYLDLSERHTERAVWPLGCFYWATVWTFATWCEVRSDFRGFRVDRNQTFATLHRACAAQAGRTLADMLWQVCTAQRCAPAAAPSLTS